MPRAKNGTETTPGEGRVAVTRRALKPKGETEHVEHTPMDDISSTSTDVEDTYYTKYPNRWSRVRELLRDAAAEFLGTMVLVIFGNGVDCQAVLSSNTAVASSAKGGYYSINVGWAVGTALGVWISGGISGGHINPAVTIAMATMRDFPWRKVPVYIAAQVLGGVCGAGVVYANYFHAINIYEGGPHIRSVPGTASLFSTYALDYMTNVSCFFDEFVGTVCLLLVVCALNDRNNGPPPPGLVPLAMFIAVLGIGASLGMQTGYAINPARDFGPRLLTAMVGYGKAVFTYRHQYWLWCPIIGPIVGAIVGVLIYDLFIFRGKESVVNKPDARSRAANARAPSGERQKPPAGVDNV
ncbi:aquaporin [Wolfiporia cocos MD-104 SS10]|uniref:Aquaporin n=1 Tax=Wolfiporia cocos (strain MD-104) TaxID=742152 RepID=A0A2H3JDE1_WOLCO|nr:aquaporin [Wolfiporia cocos MD-104 SS10]